MPLMDTACRWILTMHIFPHNLENIRLFSVLADKNLLSMHRFSETIGTINNNSPFSILILFQVKKVD